MSPKTQSTITGADLIAELETAVHYRGKAAHESEAEIGRFPDAAYEYQLHSDARIVAAHLINRARDHQLQNRVWSHEIPTEDADEIFHGAVFNILNAICEGEVNINKTNLDQLEPLLTDALAESIEHEKLSSQLSDMLSLGNRPAIPPRITYTHQAHRIVDAFILSCFA